MNCLDATQSTIHHCDGTDRGVNYSVTILEINVFFSSFKTFMLTVSIRYLIMTSTRKAGYSHFEIITGFFSTKLKSLSFSHPGKITHTPLCYTFLHSGLNKNVQSFKKLILME